MPTLVANGLDLQTARIQNLGDPSGAQDAATRAYVDAVARGLDWKQSVRAGSSGNVTLSGPGASIDGVTMATNDRFLAFGQTTAAENGIYVWNGAAVAATRAVDADASAEVTSGMAVSITEGTANGDKTYVLTTNDPITLGTTALVFSQLGGGGSAYIGGNGLTLTGQTFDVGAGTGITVGADTVAIDPAVVQRSYTALIGDGSATSITVTHNLGTTFTKPFLFRVSDGVEIIPDVTARTANTVTLAFTAAPASNALRVLVSSFA